MSEFKGLTISVRVVCDEAGVDYHAGIEIKPEQMDLETVAQRFRMLEVSALRKLDSEGIIKK